MNPVLLPQTSEQWLLAGLTHAAAATALAAAVWGLTRLWRNPHAARVLWLAVLLKLLCPPVVAVSLADWAAQPPPSPDRQGGAVPYRPPLRTAPAIEAPATDTPPPRIVPPVRPPAVVQRTEPRSVVEPRPLPDGRGSWPAAAAILFSVWGGGSAVLWGIAAGRAVRFSRAVRRLPDADERLRTLLNRAAARVGVRAPALKISPTVGPLLWAGPVGRAVVVVPSELFAGLPDDQAEALLTHECAHLARRDHLARWLELLACGAWWWLPTAWLAAAAGRRCEEVCCDAAVLAARPSDADPADPAAAYAAGLLAAAAFLSKAPPAPVPAVPLPASGIGRPPTLKTRFEMILSDTLPRRPGRAARGALLTACAAAALTGLTLTAQESPPAAAPPGASAGGETPDEDANPNENVIVGLAGEAAEEPAEPAPAEEPAADAAGLSAEVQARIAAALEAAADDPALPAATRLKMLRESVESGGLTEAQNAALFAEFVTAMKRKELELRALRHEAGKGGEPVDGAEWAQVMALQEARDPLVATMAALHAVAPTADAARAVAEYALTRGVSRTDIEHARTTLTFTAEQAVGLRALVRAAGQPDPPLPADFAERQLMDLHGPVGTLARGFRKARSVHGGATNLLLDAIRNAKPTTDAAARVLLEAAAGEDPAVRAAAVEALAAADLSHPAPPADPPPTP